MTRKYKSALTVAFALISPPSHAACPTYSFTLSYSSADVPAQSGTLTDSDGNTWTWTAPDFPPVTRSTVPVTLTPVTCSASNAFSNVFVFSNGGLSPDDGFNGCGEGAVVGTYTTLGNIGQSWTWDNNSHLIGGSCTGAGLKDNGSGLAIISATPDALALTPAGVYPNAGFTIKSTVTGKYLGRIGNSLSAPGSLVFGTTQTVWKVTATHN